MTDTLEADVDTRARIRETLRESIEEIGAFVASSEFQALLAELYARPEGERAEFVTSVILNEEERAKRGVEVPADMAVKRTIFADGRPTLFCVMKKVPLAYPWQKVTVTFDSR